MHWKNHKAFLKNYQENIPHPGAKKTRLIGPFLPFPPLTCKPKTLGMARALKKIGGHLLIIPPLPKNGEDAISHDVPFQTLCNNCSSDNIF